MFVYPPESRCWVGLTLKVPFILLFCNHTHLPLSADMPLSLPSLTPGNYCLLILSFQKYLLMIAWICLWSRVQLGWFVFAPQSIHWTLLALKNPRWSWSLACSLDTGFQFGYLSVSHDLSHVAFSPTGPFPTWLLVSSSRVGTSLHVSSGL